MGKDVIGTGQAKMTTFRYENCEFFTSTISMERLAPPPFFSPSIKEMRNYRILIDHTTVVKMYACSALAG